MMPVVKVDTFIITAIHQPHQITLPHIPNHARYVAVIN